MDSINDILSSLSDEDMENLRAMADSLFSDNADKKDSQTQQTEASMPDFGSILGNAQMMAKISALMCAMNRKDDKTRLIEALKPLLSEKRRKKADEAMQMMKLFELLPTLTQLMGGDKN